MNKAADTERGKRSSFALCTNEAADCSNMEQLPLVLMALGSIADKILWALRVWSVENCAKRALGCCVESSRAAEEGITKEALLQKTLSQLAAVNVSEVWVSFADCRFHNEPRKPWWIYQCLISTVISRTE